MYKLLLGGAALVAATAANAAVSINFGSAPGNLGTSHAYTSSGLTVTATGYSASNTTTALYGKSAGGDEVGLGLAADPSHDNEIYYPGSDFIQLDVHALFGLVTGGTYFMGSSTGGEMWKVYGSNTAGQLGTLLYGDDDELSHALLSFGTYKYYNFAAAGTKNCGWWGCSTSDGNVLLGGLSLTPSVPEPSTWAMMLLGFGGIGVALRRRRSKPVARLA
jgi:PEP-CTERM motif